eukprot:6450081-Amphidinium_carterae.1
MVAFKGRLNHRLYLVQVIDTCIVSNQSRHHCTMDSPNMCYETLALAMQISFGQVFRLALTSRSEIA